MTRRLWHEAAYESGVAHLASRLGVRLAGALVWLVAVAVGLGGCGEAPTKKGAATSADRPTPAYRVGQYCLPNRETGYRAAGFECRHHHLARR